MSIDANRLLGRLEQLSRIGSTPEGGVTRLALSDEDRQARALVLSWATARGFLCRRDAIGNLFVRRPGSDEALPPIVTGSHLDTQRNGGNLDGIYGVIAGLEVLESLEDNGIFTRSPFELAIWNNEEGVRFAPVTMGSGVWAGRLSLADLLDQKDRDGVSLRTAIAGDRAALPDIGEAAFAEPFRAYVEAHIEQGPALEAADKVIGVVTGIQGVRQFRFRVKGEAAHAGTTPHATRKDAFVGAMELYRKLRELSGSDDQDVRFTVGTFHILPGTPNTVPGEVTFTVDFRTPDEIKLRDRGDKMLAVGTGICANCKIDVSALIHSQPIIFDPIITQCVAEVSEAAGLPAMPIPSGATHDALNVASIGPAGMVFVPSIKGISHNPRENTKPEDLVAGCGVLLATLLKVDAKI